MLFSVQFLDLFPAAIGLLISLLLMSMFGWGVGTLTNLFEFRHRRFSFQLLISLLLAAAMLPALLYWIVRFSSVPTATVLLGISAVISVLGALLVMVRSQRLPQLRRAEILWGMVVLVGAVIVLAELSDMRINGHLLINMATGDHKKDSLITNAILQTGVPPLNPAYVVGKTQPATYYYFWALVAAIMSKFNLAAPGNGRIAFFGMTAVSWVLLVSVVALYLRQLRGSKGLITRLWIALGLFLVTGLDLLATYILHLGGRPLPGAVDSWNWQAQYPAWHSTILWAPQHVVAMALCLFALLIFWETEKITSRRSRVIHSVVVSITLASAIGISVWVTLVFALFWVIYMLFLLIWRSPVHTLQGVLIGLLSFAIAAPFLLELIAGRATGMPIAFAPLISSFALFPPNLTPDRIGIPLFIAIEAALFPAMYFMEMGFAGGCAYVYWRYIAPRKPSPQHRVELLLLVVALGVASFIRSIIMNNDLGWRSFLFVQFVLLIWSVEVTLELFPHLKARFASPLKVFARRPFLRWGMMALLIVGVGGVFYDLIGLHTIVDSTYTPGLLEDGRQTFDYIEANTPPNAVVQVNPAPSEAYTVLYLRRPMRLVDVNDAVVFGTPREDASQLWLALSPVFDAHANSTVANVASLCQQFQIDYWVISVEDTVWNDPSTWIWSVAPWYETRTSKVFACTTIISTANRGG